MRNLIKNKKAQFASAIIGIILFIVVTFTIVIIFGVFIYTGDTIQSELHAQLDEKSTTTTNYTERIDEIFGDVTMALTNLRWASFFLIFGLIIAQLAGAYLSPSKPIYFIWAIFVVVMGIIVAVEVSNAYEETLLTDPNLGATFQSFKGSNFIMIYLPLWVGVVGILSGIISAVMFFKEEAPYGYR